jgi:DNA polymerase III subunit gamma/tau
MPYLSLYRKYRPQTFAEVAGQDHVVQTLQNALRYGHVANGYLFCGTRGVAKTTIARILSKCLNCIGTDGTVTSPQPEPCNACEPCRSIQTGQNVDVVELDAASNRSVTDIAKLRESVQFGPMQSRFKVYIVDEAHQLSSDAKDAFLKTLEEPPSNVVFILATTEAHSIPITIASRCQQFDFRRGSVAQLAEQCRRVLIAEGVELPADALAIVARAADGSYRDALSLLDQVLAYKRDGLTASDVAAALGTVESEAIDAALTAVAAGDTASLFAQADSIYLQGKDVRQFLRALAARIRDLLYVRSGAVGATDAGDERAKMLSQSFSSELLVRMLEIAAAAERDTRHSDQHRLLLEMTLLKLSVARAAPAVQFSAAPVVSAPRAAVPKIERPSTPRQPEPSGKPADVASPNGLGDEAPLPEPPIEDQPQSIPAQPEDAASVLRRLRASWQEIIHNVQVRHPGGVKVVVDAKPVSITGNTITLEFSQRANLALMENVARRQAIEKVINYVMKLPEGAYKVKSVVAAVDPPPDPARGAAQKPSTALPSIDDEPTPILDAVIKEFGGRIIEGED